MAFQEYPKAMSHPQHRAAILSKDMIDPITRQTIKAAPGQPAKFPPVYVNNKDQEADYASKGYVPNGISDPEAYLSAIVGADKPNYHSHVEFPKFLYTKDDEGDFVVTDDSGAQVSVKSIYVKDQAQQDKLVGAWYATPGDAANADEEIESKLTEVEEVGEESVAPEGQTSARGGRRNR